MPSLRQDNHSAEPQLLSISFALTLKEIIYRRMAVSKKQVSRIKQACNKSYRQSCVN